MGARLGLEDWGGRRLGLQEQTGRADLLDGLLSFTLPPSDSSKNRIKKREREMSGHELEHGDYLLNLQKKELDPENKSGMIERAGFTSI